MAPKGRVLLVAVWVAFWGVCKLTHVIFVLEIEDQHAKHFQRLNNHHPDPKEVRVD